MQSNDTQTLKVSTLWAVSLSVFMVPFMISSVNIALPDIQAEFSVNAVLLSWIATAYLLASGVVLVPAGKLGDIYGRKKIFTIGIAVFTVFTVATAFAPSICWIIAFRILQGVGAAMSMATSMAIISDVFPVKERGKAMGIVVACVYIGYSFGPFAGGWLTALFGWKSIFLVNVPIGIAALYLAIVKIRNDWANAEKERFDIVGSLLYGISIICLMFGLTSLPDLSGIGLLGVGITGFIIFVCYITKARFPVIDVYLFRSNRTFVFSSLAALINYSATFAVAFLLSLYLQFIKGMTPQLAGIVLVSQPLIQAVFSPLAGRLSDKTEPAVIASSGMGLTAFGLFLLVFLNSETSIFFIVISLLILGLGFALFSSPNMNAIMSSVEKSYYGIASGTVATMRLIGQMFSMAAVTFLFSLIIGDEEISPSNYDAFLSSINILFIIFTLSCLIGIYFSLTRGKLKKV
ncbi:MFS transporter [Desulfobulbus rhabdoformis]|uniref:MFS transporter n=1 Tax=Desulfobulbus rhabdoformis TaxID=34032 RepID=UPI0019635DB5|nr:MFS transporter [Desulfobulbus rhabdoformis]MBM9616971.1 MFS transporter [Desulfobulbus rhabdoformis]